MRTMTKTEIKILVITVLKHFRVFIFKFPPNSNIVV